MQIAVILPAAGAGTRFFEKDDAPNALSKVEVALSDKPMFLRTLDLFVGRSEVSQILLPVPPDRLEAFKLAYGDRFGFLGVQLIAGGTVDRWETVMLAMEQVDTNCTHIAVHDAARPLTSDALIQRCFEAAEQYDAVIPGQPVNATLKRVEPVTQDATDDPLAGILDAPASGVEISRVVETVDRAQLVEVQTPQVFKASLLREVYDALRTVSQKPQQITDDAGLVQWMGQPVYVVPGEPTNVKVTRPADLALAQAILAYRTQQEAGKNARKRLFADEDA